MLYQISSINDRFFQYLQQDPVRPNIDSKKRIGSNRDVFVLCQNDEPNAITCVSYQSDIPTIEQELFITDNPNIAVFYSIWSYRSGAGRELIFETVQHLKNTAPNIKRFLTMSPKTEMARRFHLSNGAVIFKDNLETTNYEYLF